MIISNIFGHCDFFILISARKQNLVNTHSVYVIVT